MVRKEDKEKKTGSPNISLEDAVRLRLRIPPRFLRPGERNSSSSEPFKL